MKVYRYHWHRKGRKDQRCIVLARGTMNSCAVMFLDGYTMVTSRNALRKDKSMTQEQWQAASGEKLTQDTFREKLGELVDKALKSGLDAGEIHAELDGQKMMLDEIQAENDPAGDADS